MEVSQSEVALELWRGVCHEAEIEGADMVDATLERAPEQTTQIAREAASSFRTWIAALPEDTRALVIGHSPFMELLAYGLNGIILKQLQPCEGFFIQTQKDGTFLLTERRLT